jgi:hypothetical protein
MNERLPVVTETLEQLQEYEASRQHWETNAREDYDFYHGAQWTEAQKNELLSKNQNPIVVNVIYPAVEQARAMLTTNKPRFSTTGREDSDTKTGKIFSELLTWVWDNNDGNVKLKQMITDYYVLGMGCGVVYFDPRGDFGKGEIKFDSINPMNVYIDPNSKDPFCKDAASIMLVDTYTEEQIKSKYPDFDVSIAVPAERQRVGNAISNRYGSEGQNDFLWDEHHTKYEIIDAYYKKQVSRYHVYDPISGMEKVLTAEEYAKYREDVAVSITEMGKTRFLTQQNDIDEALELIDEIGPTYHFMPNPADGSPMMMPGPAHEGAFPNSQVDMDVLPISDLIEMGVIVVDEILQDRIWRRLIIGEVLYAENWVNDTLSEYPVFFIMNRHRRDPYPLSDVRVVRPLQEYVNKIRSLIQAHASSSTNVKLLIPEGSVDKVEIQKEWSKAGTGVITFNAEAGNHAVPIVVGPIPLPNELYKNEADARKDIQEILGIYALMQGDSGQAPATYKGTLALDEYGQRRIKSKKDDIEAGLNHLARIIIQYIQYYYTEPKVIRILRPNNSPLEVAINQPIYDDATGAINGKLNDVTVGHYDVVIVSGSMLPSNRWAQFEYYVQMYQLGLIDQVEVLKKTEVVDVEGVLNRFSELQALRQQVAQLEETVKNLEGDLQTATREAVHTSKRLEVEKFKGDLKGLSSEARAATKVYEEGLKADRKVQNAKSQTKTK